MNLLPKEEKENLKKGLKLRSVIMILFLLSTSFFVGFITLLPSYFLISGYFFDNGSEKITKEEDANLTREFSGLPSEISSKLGFFRSGTDNEPLADYFSKIANLLPADVWVDSFSFLKNQKYKGKEGLLILLSGKAANRDSLVLFLNTLRESKLFSEVDIPVSVLAKEKNLPFNISIFIED